jgi:hypothetical protein
MLDREDDVGRAGRGRQRRDQCADERPGALNHNRRDHDDGCRQRHLQRELNPEHEGG